MELKLTHEQKLALIKRIREWEALMGKELTPMERLTLISYIQGDIA